MNYYNENDKHAAAWLRQLIADGLLPDGHVDERSIEHVTPIELAGYRQCHFFAGIGGWSIALALSGWPSDAPVWTGSCPCQPFSNTGKSKGSADQRHLWPSFYWLVDQCRPAIVFGEQVATKLGRAWWAGVRTDLEIAGYETGAADLCAASVGAPHIRQRLYWLAYGSSERFQELGLPTGCEAQQDSEVGRRGEAGGLGLALGAGLERLDQHGIGGAEFKRTDQDADGSVAAPSGFNVQPFSDPWSEFEWTYCADGYHRRTKPGVLLLADGVPSRAPLIRGYGNAIVPALAAQFIKASIQSINDREQRHVWK